MPKAEHDPCTAMIIELVDTFVERKLGMSTLDGKLVKMPDTGSMHETNDMVSFEVRVGIMSSRSTVYKGELHYKARTGRILKDGSPVFSMENLN